jgi:crotonobetainyl-CoA:carnitine CoA-transferase CaiB-like acyl-CoA transferase
MKTPRGLGPVQSFYHTADGWIYLDAGRIMGETTARLRQVAILRASEGPKDLTGRILATTSPEAIAQLSIAGIPATTARNVSDVLRDQRLLDAERYRISISDDGHSLMQTGRYAGFSRTQRRGPMIPPGAGEHSRKVLEEAGLAAEEINSLISCQAVISGDKVAHILPISYR